MATPAFHAASSSAETNNAGGLTITRPASTLSGYFAVAFMYMEDNSTGVAVTHTGWTALTGGFDTASNPDMRLVAAYRVCDGTSADDFTPTWSGTIYSGGGMIVVKPSAAGTLALDAQGTATADNTSPHTGTITTVATETMLIGGIVNFQEVALTPGSTGGTPTEAVDTPGTWIGYRAEASAGSKTMDASSAGGTAVVVKLVSVKETPGSDRALAGSQPAATGTLTATPITPTVVGAGTAAFTATNGATLAPGLPAGWAADDIHVLLAARSDNTAMTSLSPDWISLSAANNTAAQRVEVWIRRAVGGDAAPTVTFGSGTVVRGARIIGIRGVDPALDLTTLQLSRSDNAASATITFATITPTPSNTKLLALYAYEDDPTAASQITDWTTFTISTSSLGNDMALGYAQRAWPSASSATGSLTSTASGGTFANSVNTGILLDFPPPATGGATRSVAGSEPAATGTLARILAALRSVAGAQPAASATLTRMLAAARTVAGSQPTASGTLTRSAASLRSLDGAQPAGSGALTYLRGYARTLAGSQPSGAGALTRTLAAFRTVAGSQPSATGTLTRQAALSSTLAGSQPAATGTVTRILGALRAVAGAQDAPSATLTAQSVVSRTAAGAQPAATGALSRIYGALRATSGAQDAPVGTLARTAGAFARTLTGSQPAATGTLARILGALRALAGAMPGGSATLGSAQGAQSRALDGSQPAPTGVLTRIMAAVRALTGAQPAATGTLARTLAALRALDGAQPSASGTLAHSKANVRALAGSQPAPTGSLENLFTTTRLLAGTQPAAVGGLTRAATLARSLDGAQPAASGLLGRIAAYGRALAGSQDAPSGVLAVVLAVIVGLAEAVVTRSAPATATVSKVEPATATVTVRTNVAEGEVVRV